MLFLFLFILFLCEGNFILLMLPLKLLLNFGELLLENNLNLFCVINFLILETFSELLKFSLITKFLILLRPLFTFGVIGLSILLLRILSMSCYFSMGDILFGIL